MEHEEGMKVLAQGDYLEANPPRLKCSFHYCPFWDTSSLQLLKSKVCLMEKRFVTENLRLYFFSLTEHQGV